VTFEADSTIIACVMKWRGGGGGGRRRRRKRKGRNASFYEFLTKKFRIFSSAHVRRVH
jgi:hypothetical protein